MDEVPLDKLVEATSAIRRANHVWELREAFERFAASLGFDWFSFSCNVADHRDLVVAPMMTNWPDEFLHLYNKHHWIEHDVLLASAFSAERGIIWSLAELGRGNSGPKGRGFLGFLQAMQRRGGVIALTCDNGLYSALSFETSAARVPPKFLLEAASILADTAILRCEAIGIGGNAARGASRLSARQLEILKWVAEGKSNTVIALITGQPLRTVNYHMSEILRKLGVATRAQAVALLIAGLIY